MATGEIFTEQGDLARRRRLLEAMQSQNMQTGIVGSNRGSSIGQALTKVATAYILANKGKGLAEQETANREAYGGALQGELGDYMNLRQGQAPQELPGPEAPGFPRDVQPGIQANPREAVVRAMASQFPELQAIGKADFASLGKGSGEKFSGGPQMMRGPDGKPIQVLIGDQGTVKPITGYTPAIERKVTAGGHLYDPYGGTREGFVGSQFDKPRPGPGGTLLQNDTTTGQTTQIVGRPPVGTTVNVNAPGQKVGMEELAKKYAANVSEMGQTAQASRKLIGALDQLGKLTDTGTFTGPLADPAVWLNRLAGSAGVAIDKNKLSNSEAYASVASEAAQRLIGQFGGNRGVTSQEAEQIKQIIPQLQSSPQARYQLATILRKTAQQSMEDYRAAHQNYVKFTQTQDPSTIDPLLYGSQMPTEQPTPPQPGMPGKGPSASNW